VRKAQKERMLKTPSSPLSSAGKPKLFLGCSSEAKPIAEALMARLADVAEVHPWWESEVFRPTQSTLTGLIDACRDFYDFGLFLLTPDDVMEFRGAKSRAPRDNVWFEFGLFLGGIGDHRTFALAGTRKKMRLASDLDGIGISRLQWAERVDTNSITAKRAIEKIKREITRNGRNHGAFILTQSWGCDRRPLRFSVDLNPVRLARHRLRLFEQQLVLFVAREDPDIDPWEDTRIYRSRPRRIGNPLPANVRLVAELDRKVKGVIYANLFLVPIAVDVAKIKTMAELRDQGGLRLDRIGQEID
jgi:predicted nucleotide-binding protein